MFVVVLLDVSALTLWIRLSKLLPPSIQSFLSFNKFFVPLSSLWSLATLVGACSFQLCLMTNPAGVNARLTDNDVVENTGGSTVRSSWAELRRIFLLLGTRCNSKLVLGSKFTFSSCQDASESPEEPTGEIPGPQQRSKVVRLRTSSGRGEKVNTTSE